MRFDRRTVTLTAIVAGASLGVLILVLAIVALLDPLP